MARSPSRSVAQLKQNISRSPDSCSPGGSRAEPGTGFESIEDRKSRRDLVNTKEGPSPWRVPVWSAWIKKSSPDGDCSSCGLSTALSEMTSAELRVPADAGLNVTLITHRPSLDLDFDIWTADITLLPIPTQRTCLKARPETSRLSLPPRRHRS